jgi:hypothetical protein
MRRNAPTKLRRAACSNAHAPNCPLTLLTFDAVQTMIEPFATSRLHGSVRHSLFYGATGCRAVSTFALPGMQLYAH